MHFQKAALSYNIKQKFYNVGFGVTHNLHCLDELIKSYWSLSGRKGSRIHRIVLCVAINKNADISLHAHHIQLLKIDIMFKIMGG